LRPQPTFARTIMLRNPLARHIALFLLVKLVLIALGLWWFLASAPTPRGLPPPSAIPFRRFARDRLRPSGSGQAANGLTHVMVGCTRPRHD
jgi:hypothetical protein